MPHLVVEYSDNLPRPLDHRALCAALHDALEGTGLFKRADMKSRVVARNTFYSGAGEPENVFVHLTVHILTGRDLAVRKRLGAELLDVLTRGLGPTWNERRCDVTVDVREMERETYAKMVSDG